MTKLRKVFGVLFIGGTIAAGTLAVPSAANADPALQDLCPTIEYRLIYASRDAVAWSIDNVALRFEFPSTCWYEGDMWSVSHGGGDPTYHGKTRFRQSAVQ